MSQTPSVMALHWDGLDLDCDSLIVTIYRSSDGAEPGAAVQAKTSWETNTRGVVQP